MPCLALFSGMAMKEGEMTAVDVSMSGNAYRSI